MRTSILPSDLPRFNPIEIDARVLAFTAALVLATTIVFALVPALRAAEANVSHALREAGRGMLDSVRGRRVRAALVVATSIDQVQNVMFGLSSAGYLPAIGAHLRSGRFFSEDDRASSPQVAIINEALARQFFAGENPIGQSIATRPPIGLLPPEARHSDDLAPVRRIVGVIADIKDARMGEPAQPTVYVPTTQARNEGWMGTWPLVVRTTGDPLAVGAAVQHAAARGLRGAGAAAGGDRHLWCDGLQRLAAAA